MSARRALALPAAAMAVYALAVFAQFHVDALHKELPKNDELTYLPNERLLSHLTCGMSSIVADLLWVECATYVGREVKGEHSFRWLNQLVNTVVRLDPHFVGAYRYGGMFLAGLRADDNGSLDLLRRGIVENPYAWELPYEAAMVYILNRRDDPDSPRRAAVYLSMSAALPDAPVYVREYAVKMQGQYDMIDLEDEMWAQLQSSPDSLLRTMAKRKLQESALRRFCRDVNKVMDEVQAHGGKRPATLEEMVGAGVLRGVPADPLGGRFFVDASGHVQSTTLLDSETQQALDRYRSAINHYFDDKKIWPPNLDALRISGYIINPPPHPYADQHWKYDPATGTIQ